MEVAGLTGAAYGKKSTERLAQRNGPVVFDPPVRPGSAPSCEARYYRPSSQYVGS